MTPTVQIPRSLRALTADIIALFDYTLYTLQIKGLGLYGTATTAKLIWTDVKDNIKHPAATTVLVTEIQPVGLVYLPMYHASKIV